MREPLTDPLPDTLLRRCITQGGLDLPNDRSEDAGGEKSRAERTGGVLTDRRQLPKRRPGSVGHAPELPGDLVTDGIGPIRSGQPSRVRGVGGRAERVRAHVRNTGGLGSSSGSSHGRRRTHGSRSPTGNEPSSYLTGRIELTASERPSSSDGITWSTICGSLRFEQDQDPLSTVCRPRRDLAAMGFTQRLRGRHASSLPHRPQANPERVS